MVLSKARPYGERAACVRCEQDIEWLGARLGWRDRGGNRQCVAWFDKGEIRKPKRGQKHRIQKED